jgi:putative nucleotidyltransferase with HDIG domain
MFRRTETHPFRRDLVREYLTQKWLVRPVVYPLVTLLWPILVWGLGLSPLAALVPTVGGYIIATIGIELGYFVGEKLVKLGTYPTMLAMELGPVHNLGKACQKGVETVASWLNAKAAVLVCLQRDGEGWEAWGAYNLPHNWPEKVQTASLNLQPFEEAIRREQVIVRPLEHDDAWAFFVGDGYQAAYVPVMSLDTPVGVLSLIGNKSNPDLKDRRLLTALGMVMGLILDNIRLYDYEYQAVLEILCSALDLRDRVTEGHSRRVAALSLGVAREMGVNRAMLKDLERAAILHDIGKITVPDAVLSKPGPLTDAEWEEMHRHPVVGFDMVRNVPLLRQAADIIYAHHEHFDGSGYPNALKGEEIPLGARIFAVVDAYDAITSDRPYRKARPHEYALEEIKRETGTQFDPKVVDAFFEAGEKGLLRGDGSSPVSGQRLRQPPARALPAARRG